MSAALILWHEMLSVSVWLYRPVFWILLWVVFGQEYLVQWGLRILGWVSVRKN